MYKPLVQLSTPANTNTSPAPGSEDGQSPALEPAGLCAGRCRTAAKLSTSFCYSQQKLLHKAAKALKLNHF